jgi:hypothetical protein
LADLGVSNVPQGFLPVDLGKYESALPRGAVSVGNLRDAYHQAWDNGHGSRLDVQIVRFWSEDSAARYQEDAKAATLSDAGGAHTAPLSNEMINALPDAYGVAGGSSGMSVSVVGFSTGEYVVGVAMSGPVEATQVTIAIAASEYTRIKVLG